MPGLSRSGPRPRRAGALGRLRRLAQLWAAGAVAAVAVTAASALGWLEPIQVRVLDLLQQLGGQRFPPEVVIVAIDQTAFERLGARQPIPRAYLASVLRGLERSGAAVVGLDIAISVPTTPGRGRRLRASDPGAGERGGRRRLLGWSWWTRRHPSRAPWPSPTVLGAVPRGSDRVPIDDDGAIRRAAAFLPAPGGPPIPAFGLAALATGRSPRSAANGASRALPEDLARYPYWRGDGLGAVWRALGARSGRGARGGSTSWGRRGASSRSRAMPSPSWGSPTRRPSPTTTRSAAAWRSSAPRSPKVATSSRRPSAAWPGVEIHANVVHMLATRVARSPRRLAGEPRHPARRRGRGGVALELAPPSPGDARRSRAHRS